MVKEKRSKTHHDKTKLFNTIVSAVCCLNRFECSIQALNSTTEGEVYEYGTISEAIKLAVNGKTYSWCPFGLFLFFRMRFVRTIFQLFFYFTEAGN